MLNIGSWGRVKENGECVSVEVDILNLEGDIYEEVIKIEFVEYVGGEVKFESVEKVRWELGEDKEVVKNVLEEKG